MLISLFWPFNRKGGDSTIQLSNIITGINTAEVKEVIQAQVKISQIRPDSWSDATTSEIHGVRKLSLAKFI